jgi:hypothetical protein
MRTGSTDSALTVCPLRGKKYTIGKEMKQANLMKIFINIEVEMTKNLQYQLLLYNKN